MASDLLNPDSLSAVNLEYVIPGVVPGAVPALDVSGESKPDPRYPVADELIRLLPFVSTSPGGRPYSEQYVLRAKGALDEPSFATTGPGTPWRSGASSVFRQPLDGRGARGTFKRLGVFIEVDELMVDGSGTQADVLELEVRLAATGLVRALSAAILQSAPRPEDGAAKKANGLYYPDVQELSGLPAFVGGTGQDVAWDKAAGLVSGLAAIEALCHPSDGDFGAQADVFVMSSRARRLLLSELEALGVTPDFRPSSLTRRLQLHFHGIPVLTGRVREAADGSSEAWALKLFGPTGIRVLHVGGNPAAYGIQVEQTLVSAARSGNSVGPVTVRKGAEVFGVYSLAFPEPQSAARLSGIPADAPAAAR